MKKIFFDERYYILTYSILITILIYLYFFSVENLIIPEKDSLKELGNLLGTIVSIFISFQGVTLTLILQSDNNKSIKMLKENNLFGLFVSYFKDAILIGAMCLFMSIILTLGVKVSHTGYFLIIYTFVFALNILSNFRIYKFFFKIISDH